MICHCLSETAELSVSPLTVSHNSSVVSLDSSERHHTVASLHSLAVQSGLHVSPDRSCYDVIVTASLTMDTIKECPHTAVQEESGTYVNLEFHNKYNFHANNNICNGK